MYEIELELAENTSAIAADYLLKNFIRDPSLFSNRSLSKDITTIYDKGSDFIIIDPLKAKSVYNILTEESGLIDRGSDGVWLVDSLDGTSNHSNGEPYFSVSIGLVKGNEPLVGSINAPFLGEVYSAKKGGGSKRNGTEIRVSGTRELENGYFVYCEGGEKNNKRIAKIVCAFLPDIKDMRKIGSAAIECARVATGQRDAYITTSIYPWDVAAGVLLVQEAGGKVTDFDGNPWKPEKTDLVASNGILHEEILEKLAKLK